MCEPDMVNYLFGASEQAAPAATEYGAGAAGDYLMGATPAAAEVASDYAAGPMWAGIPAGGDGGGTSLASVTNAIKPYVGPAVTGGSIIYGANAQNNMMKGLNQAQGQSYDQYLNALNPPEETKAAMYGKAVNQILPTANLMMRKTSNDLASRGVRGQGLASPITGLNRDVTKAKQNAYLDIYGKYNVPQALPPVNYASGTGNLMGKNVSDIGTLMLMKQLFA